MRISFLVIIVLFVLLNMFKPLLAEDMVSLKSRAICKKDLRYLVQAYYDSMNLSKKGLAFDLFYDGVKGYLNLKKAGVLKKDVVTLIDFSKPSTEKRLWIIDLKNKEVLEHSLVAHGKNSGDTFAVQFSNTPNSRMSSLGFYVTNEVYVGKHGLSLRMEGMDNTNSNARSRAIVLHGAEYVSKEFVKNTGRLGRSWGCPAVPVHKTNKIIETIKEGSVLLIKQSRKNLNSGLLDEVKANNLLDLLP